MIVPKLYIDQFNNKSGNITIDCSYLLLHTTHLHLRISVLQNFEENKNRIPWFHDINFHTKVCIYVCMFEYWQKSKILRKFTSIWIEPYNNILRYFLSKLNFSLKAIHVVGFGSHSTIFTCTFFAGTIFIYNVFFFFAFFTNKLTTCILNSCPNNNENNKKKRIIIEDFKRKTKYIAMLRLFDHSNPLASHSIICSSYIKCFSLEIYDNCCLPQYPFRKYLTKSNGIWIALSDLNVHQRQPV